MFIIQVVKTSLSFSDMIKIYTENLNCKSLHKGLGLFGINGESTIMLESILLLGIQFPPIDTKEFLLKLYLKFLPFKLGLMFP